MHWQTPTRPFRTDTLRNNPTSRTPGALPASHRPGDEGGDRRGAPAGVGRNPTKGLGAEAPRTFGTWSGCAAGLPGVLRRTLATTNSIESALSVTRRVTARRDPLAGRRHAAAVVSGGTVAGREQVPPGRGAPGHARAAEGPGGIGPGGTDWNRTRRRVRMVGKAASFHGYGTGTRRLLGMEHRVSVSCPGARPCPTCPTRTPPGPTCPPRPPPRPASASPPAPCSPADIGSSRPWARAGWARSTAPTT